MCANLIRFYVSRPQPRTTLETVYHYTVNRYCHNIRLNIRDPLCSHFTSMSESFNSHSNEMHFEYTFSVDVTAITADIDLDEARFPLQIDAHTKTS